MKKVLTIAGSDSSGGAGSATFRNDMIDAVFNLTETQLTQGVCYEIYQG